MTSAQEQSRAERLREYEQALAHAARVVEVMGVVVRGREARGWSEAEPPEVRFASCAADDGRALPAAVWVALRRDDGPSVLDELTDASTSQFVLSRREEVGEGYRLQTVEETRPMPDVDLLLGQLSRLLEIPVDVLGVLGQWGIDDARTESEVDALLDSRFGGSAAPRGSTEMGGLTMSVQETADVLQLTAAQAKVLATLVRRVGVTITP
jgi:hypothetical protein